MMGNVPTGYILTLSEARERLFYIRNHGETPYSFSFKKRFTHGESAEFKQS